MEDWERKEIDAHELMVPHNRLSLMEGWLKVIQDGGWLPAEKTQVVICKIQVDV